MRGFLVVFLHVICHTEYCYVIPVRGIYCVYTHIMGLKKEGDCFKEVCH